jgi:hypothetical protein
VEKLEPSSSSRRTIAVALDAKPCAARREERSADMEEGAYILTKNERPESKITTIAFIWAAVLFVKLIGFINGDTTSVRCEEVSFLAQAILWQRKEPLG